jgi:methyl-accepting chemotaxis protein
MSLLNFRKQQPTNDSGENQGPGLRAVQGGATGGNKLEPLVTRAERALELLQALSSSEPMARLDALAERLSALDQRLVSTERLTTELGAAQKRADELKAANEQMAAEIERVRTSAATLGTKLDAALGLREQLDRAAAVQQQLVGMRGQTDAFMAEMRDITGNIARLRTVHDDVLNAHKHATARLDLIDQRHQTVDTKMVNIEQRAVSAQQALDAALRLAAGVPDAQHQLAVLKVTADQVTQKMAILEQHRDALDRVTTQAANIVGLRAELDQAARRQEEHARTLSTVEEKLGELQAAHAPVVARCEEIANTQHRLEEAEREATRTLDNLREEMKASTERFELETRTLDAVSERIADLRGGVGNCEQRLTTMDDTARRVAEVEGNTRAVATQLATVIEDVTRISSQAERLRAVRDDVGELDRTLSEMRERFNHVDSARAMVSEVATELGELRGAHEALRDGLEQMRVAHDEMTRLRDRQAETDAWLGDADQKMAALRGQVVELESSRPAVETLRGEVEHLSASLGAVESRAHVVETLHQRMGELETLLEQLSSRSETTGQRMDAAEARFTELSRQAGEAQRVSATIGTVAATVDGAERRIQTISGTLEGLETRAKDLEGLGERVRIIGTDLEQRQAALDRASEHLARASESRREAAEAAQQLEDLSRNMTAQLSSLTSSIAASPVSVISSNASHDSRRSSAGGRSRKPTPPDPSSRSVVDRRCSTRSRGRYGMCPRSPSRLPRACATSPRHVARWRRRGASSRPRGRNCRVRRRGCGTSMIGSDRWRSSSVAWCARRHSPVT